MRELLSQAGVKVRSKFDPSRIGESTGQVVEDDGEVQAKIRFPGESPRWVYLDELEPVDVPLDETALISEGRFAPPSLLRRVLTAVQLSGDVSELIYSLDMTNTEFMPHQFKPLLALLDSPSRGVLIADEVGLGKTIEAGLIWTELRFRTHATTMLVVCPAMLTEKWKVELAKRFGTPSVVMGPAELLEWLNERQHQPHARAIICSLQGLRPSKDWATDGQGKAGRAANRLAAFLDERQHETLFDLTVIDEAHYLRNDETSSSVLGKLLRPVSEHLVLLSATPVNTGNDDLFNLVKLVDPQQFQFKKQFSEVVNSNRPLVIAANALKRANCTAGDLAESLDAAEDSWLLNKSEGLRQLSKEVAALPPERRLTASERVELSDRVQRLNLLGHALVRSRKREVFPNRVVRRVYFREAPMTEAETSLYEQVSAAVARYAMANAGVEGFLLAMPQQIMSSSMYAAAKHWGAAEDDLAAVEAYEMDEWDESEGGNARPVTQFVAQAIRGSIDTDALYEHDSKFELLLDILREQERESPGQKVLVFSFFVGTLEYLRGRLEKNNYRCAVVRGGDDKQAVISAFQSSSTHQILLASEVAAEGVDLQFMRLLINYDLPWNPMRVEQRIGRIDRIGQASPTITIFNLVYADTIDARIVARLFERLKLFEESVGSVEDVVGNAIHDLTRQLLSPALTEQEKEAAAEQAEYAIEKNRRDLEEVEASETDLIGLGDYVRDRVVRAREQRRSISDTDLLAHLRDFLDSEGAGYEFRLDDERSLVGELRLSPPIAARLESFRQARNLPHSRLEGGHVERVVIRNHVDSGTKERAELINQFHPLVRLISESQPPREGVSLYAMSLAASDLRDDVQPGMYAFQAQAWTFEGSRRESTIRAMFLSLDGGTDVPAEKGFDVLNALRAAGVSWVKASDELPDTAVVVASLDLASRQLDKWRRREADRHRSENTDRIRIQMDGIERNRARRVASWDEAIAGHRAARRVGLEKADMKRKSTLEQQVAVQMEKLKAGQDFKCRSRVLVSGVMKVLP